MPLPSAKQSQAIPDLAQVGSNAARSHPPGSGASGAPVRRQFGRWTILEYEEVASTNYLAAGLPAWHAIRAERQNAGRGRFQRQWVSDQGGLWFSAILPSPGTDTGRRLLPLAAGLAVCDALKSHGVADLQLRWPNDVMVRGRKLAGLLLDQFAAGAVVVGIGVNLRNSPESFDSRLRGQVVRLSELLPSPPFTAALLETILQSLETIVEQLNQGDFTQLLARINQLWQLPQAASLDLDGPIRSGEFYGVDASGRLILRDGGATHYFEPHQVRLFRTIETQQ